MATKPGFPAEGGCTCRSVRYRIATEPLFVHCCHCRWCQRETGAAFAINALIESSRVEVLSGQPEPVVTPSNSGRGQTIVRCPQRRIALWTTRVAGRHSASCASGRWTTPMYCRPTSTLHVVEAAVGDLPPDVPAAAEYYDRNAHWPPHSLERRRVLLASLAANQNEAPAR